MTRSQRCEPGWTPKEMAAGQDADPDIGPIMQWKRAGNDRPCWEDISPESRETKVLWRQWERLHLVRGVLHHRFYELEGHGWRHQSVVPEDRRRTSSVEAEIISFCQIRQPFSFLAFYVHPLIFQGGSPSKVDK